MIRSRWEVKYFLRLGVNFEIRLVTPLRRRLLFAMSGHYLPHEQPQSHQPHPHQQQQQPHAQNDIDYRQSPQYHPNPLQHSTNGSAEASGSRQPSALGAPRKTGRGVSSEDANSRDAKPGKEPKEPKGGASEFVKKLYRYIPPLSPPFPAPSASNQSIPIYFPSPSLPASLLHPPPALESSNQQLFYSVPLSATQFQRGSIPSVPLEIGQIALELRDDRITIISSIITVILCKE